MASDELVAVPLDSDEREILIQGVLQWGGPAASTEAFAKALGFDSVAAFTFRVPV